MNAIALEDTDSDLRQIIQSKSIIDYINERYKKAEDYRQQDEEDG